MYKKLWIIVSLTFSSKNLLLKSYYAMGYSTQLIIDKNGF